jgi:hypothetical protein
MARYAVFLGLQVEVQYRAGDILLPASGTFVGDTGRSIFLEQSFEQRGQHRQFRWEIPYQYVVRLSEKRNSTMPAISAVPLERQEAQLASQLSADQSAQQSGVERVTADEDKVDEDQDERERENVAAAVASCGSKVSVIFPRPQRSNS